MRPGVLTAVALLLSSSAAHAIPAFARKTGMSCTACHEVWPRLNDFGQLYRDNGYRLKNGKDAPVQQDPSYWPIAMRTTVGYQWLRQTLVATPDGGTATAQTGTFGFTGLDVFAAGTLGEQLSFLVTYTPALASAGFGLSPSDGNLESAFIGFHDVLGTWLNFRVGRHALDLPEDEHRQITLTQGYSSLHAHPLGNAGSNFEAGENQRGVEIYGHSALSRVRYSISVFNTGGALFSGNLVSSPGVWGHVQASHLFESGVLSEIKGGLFGAVGWQPPNLPAPDGGPPPPPPQPGLAPPMANYRRYGAELHLYFLNRAFPLTLTGVVLGGSEDAALVQGATRSASFVGGWGELSWTPTIHLTLIGRIERIRTTDAGSDDAFADAGNQTIYTGAIRHTFEISARTEAALQLELTRLQQVAAPGPEQPTTTIALAAFDIAF